MGKKNKKNKQNNNNNNNNNAKSTTTTTSTGSWLAGQVVGYASSVVGAVTKTVGSAAKVGRFKFWVNAIFDFCFLNFKWKMEKNKIFSIFCHLFFFPNFKSSKEKWIHYLLLLPKRLNWNRLRFDFDF